MRWKKSGFQQPTAHMSASVSPGMSQERQEVIDMAAQAAEFYVSLPNPMQDIENGIERLFKEHINTPEIVQCLLLKDGGVAYAKAIDALYDRYFSEINRRLSSDATSLAMAQTVQVGQMQGVCKIHASNKGPECRKAAGMPVVVRAAPESRSFYFASDGPSRKKIIKPVSFFRVESDSDIKGQLFTGLQLHTLLDHAGVAPIDDVAETARDLLALRNSRDIFKQSGRLVCDLSVPILAEEFFENNATGFRY